MLQAITADGVGPGFVHNQSAMCDSHLCINGYGRRRKKPDIPHNADQLRPGARLRPEESTRCDSKYRTVRQNETALVGDTTMPWFLVGSRRIQHDKFVLFHMFGDGKREFFKAGIAKLCGRMQVGTQMTKLVQRIVLVEIYR